MIRNYGNNKALLVIGFQRGLYAKSDSKLDRNDESKEDAWYPGADSAKIESIVERPKIKINLQAWSDWGKDIDWQKMRGTGKVEQVEFV